MRGLIEFSSRPEVRNVVEQLTGNRNVQGVVAEYQQRWLSLMHTDPRLWEEMFRWWRHFGPPYPGPPLTQVTCVPLGLGPPRDQIQATWNSWFGAEEPFQLRVCLRPGASDQDSRKLDIDTNASFPIIFEERPVARLSALRVNIGRSKGTIGGVVLGSAGDWLGITCGHVLAHGSTVSIEDKQQSLLARLPRLFSGEPPIAGECIRRTELTRLAPNAACNPYGGVDPSNTLDVGVIQAPFGNAPLRKWNGPPSRRESARSGQVAKMLSATGERAAQIGGLNIYYVLSDGPESYCFGGLFEVLAPPHHDKIVHPSDSGAWIMRHGANGDEWFGIALGSDDLRGFAMFAEPVYTWLQTERLV
ncbi:MAG TPA: hypothetical protein VG734_01660 [Lacunisphaera sp.]|nr:hypothetical protein [Lacunisphaera sp.]